MTTPRPMRPVEIWLFCAAGGGDSRQVPAAGASIVVGFQGATVGANVTCYDWGYTDVEVGHVGRIAVGDTLQVGSDSSKILFVGSISADKTKVGLSSSAPYLLVVAGDRLMVVSVRAPALFMDPAGLLPISGNILTINAIGYARFYTPEPSVDYFASGGGLASTLVFQDVQAGLAEETRPTLNVLDFPTFQAAHDALPEAGGTIFVPAGEYSAVTPCAFAGLVVTKPVTILGEALGAATVLSAVTVNVEDAENTDAIFLDVAGGCSVRNLRIEWPEGTIRGSGRGIRWYKSGHPSLMAGVTVENVVVYRSPNWSFEFTCDGHSENYVSKLEMIQCTAYGALGGGSLLLGGAGTNNNWFERCEFNGPGVGGFHNVQGCNVGLTDEVDAPHFDTPVAVEVDDEVSGMGIAVGTFVAEIVSPTRIRLNKSGIEVQSNTTLTFWRSSAGTGQLKRGHVHLLRTTISRFHHCSFQGPGTEPALSTDLVSNDLELRDSYREKDGALSGEHSFTINGMTNLLIDGLFHQFGAQASLLLKTGPGGLRMGRIANAQLATTALGTNADVISLANSSDELVIDNSFEFGGTPRDLRQPMATIVSAATLVLPDMVSEVFAVSGTTAVTSIAPLSYRRRITLISTAPLTDGTGLRLAGDFPGGADNTITLVCDGSKWLELSRGLNT